MEVIMVILNYLIKYIYNDNFTFNVHFPKRTPLL